MLKINTALIFILSCPITAFATQIPDGEYQLVGVQCEDNPAVHWSEQVDFKDVHQKMIQAKVNNRASLSAYYFSLAMSKKASTLHYHWNQLHTGQAFADARNHAPFHVTFETEGTIANNHIDKMHLLPKQSHITYLSHDFNGQHFTNEDITGRMAKSKHLGAYSTDVTWEAFRDSEQKLYRLTEKANGFGAPKHLLCGAVDATIHFIFRRHA